MEFLLQDGLGDHLGFVLGDERRREVAVQRIFHDFIILGAAQEDTDAGIFVRALAVTVQCFQIKRQLAHVFRLEAAGLEFKCDQTLEVAVVEEEIEFKILIADLYADFLADKSEAVAEFHEKFPQITQQSRLQIGLAVPLRQIQKIEQIAVLEDVGGLLWQNSRQCREFWIGGKVS